ncbi:MAG: S-methyl-5-thioribose-1-phosphate isomerase [Candidatus ainarchaeum sp.]|nr:S-methyl-5-thioribose-1-phosphate isomerase [Candidatus ainarchaeum sp.]
METISFRNNALFLLDQRKLPHKEERVKCKTYAEVSSAIKNMVVRGAPAISVAAAYGCALGAIAGKETQAYRSLISSRPTAVDLANAIGFMRANRTRKSPLTLAGEWEKTVYDKCRRLRLHGARLIPRNPKILTHCNTGPLAAGKYGTALGVIAAAHKSGKRPFVWVKETRPRFQGALTSWELGRMRIPHRVIVDSAAASLMAGGEVDLVILGADRICRNGDFANKVGTYDLAVLAHAHKIPFYVTAPSSTLDSRLKSGNSIQIERRDEKEVLEFSGKRIYAKGTRALNPAFDVTPHKLVTAYITEDGIFRSPDALWKGTKA